MGGGGYNLLDGARHLEGLHHAVADGGERDADAALLEVTVHVLDHVDGRRVDCNHGGHLEDNVLHLRAEGRACPRVDAAVARCDVDSKRKLNVALDRAAACNSTHDAV